MGIAYSPFMACCSTCEAKAKAKSETEMSDQKKSTLKSILDAIGVLRDNNPDLVKALADDAGVDASLVMKGEIDDKKSEGLGKKTEYVKDNWSLGETQGTITREEIKVGPGESASGSGAEKMVRDYSNPAAQHHGMEQAVMRMASIFEGYGKSLDVQNAMMKSMLEGNAAVKALLIQSIVAKSEGEKEEDDEDEESEVVEINASRAKSKIDAAKALIKSIKKAKSDEEKKSLRKSLRAILADASLSVTLANQAELTKSFTAVLAKADINVVQEEEDDDEEDEEADKAKKAKEATDAAAKAADAAKAKKDDQGNQADREDSANGNQAAAAKAREAEMEALKAQHVKISDALSGLAMLETSVKGMMDVVMGKAKIADTLPDIAKAKTDTIQAILDQVSEMENQGSIQPADASAARDIASMTREASAGRMDAAIVKGRLEKSSTTVRSIFSNAMTKAA